MRFWATILTGFLIAAAPAQAQNSPSDAESADTIRPKTLTIPGASQQVAHGFARSLMLERRQQDYCWEYGCLVIVNETQFYNIIGFYVEQPRRDGMPHWGPNQFGEQLYPMKATFRFKTGDASACDRPVLFVLRHKQTKEVTRIETRASLCKAPQTDSVVRIKMVKPTVTVEE